MVGRSFVVIVLAQDAERRACVRAEINLERGRGHQYTTTTTAAGTM